MKNLKTVEEKVNALTPEQQDKVLKAGKTGTILLFCTAILIFACMGIASVLFLKDPKAYLHFDKFVKEIVGIIVIGLVVCFAEYFVIKKKVPYYSDKVCAYIKKNRKNNK